MDFSIQDYIEAFSENEELIEIFKDYYTDNIINNIFDRYEKLSNEDKNEYKSALKNNIGEYSDFDSYWQEKREEVFNNALKDLEINEPSEELMFWLFWQKIAEASELNRLILTISFPKDNLKKLTIIRDGVEIYSEKDFNDISEYSTNIQGTTVLFDLQKNDEYTIEFQKKLSTGSNVIKNIIEIDDGQISILAENASENNNDNPHTNVNNSNVYDEFWIKYNNNTNVYNEYWSKYTKDNSESTQKQYKDVYNEYYDKFSNSLSCVYPEYYLKLINGLAEEKTGKQKTEGNGDWNIYSGSKNTNSDITIGSAKQPIHELRNTPGYTHYVRDVRKDLSGNITSAFLKRYYANIDAEIYMNGQWVEDIGSIQWTIDQQTMPIYGYNSYVFDAVAQGSRIIQGAFTVSFTRPRSIEEFIKQNYKSIDDSSIATPANYEQMIQRLEGYQEGIKLHRNGSELVSNKQHLPVWMNDKFDIDIVCGEKEAIGGEAVHIILKECWITRTSSSRSSDDGVATEVYQFIAKDYKTIGLSEYKGAY